MSKKKSKKIDQKKCPKKLTKKNHLHKKNQKTHLLHYISISIKLPLVFEFFYEE
jgi:hypothetical protein